MGGRALKNTETRRYERAEFEAISVELLDILKKDFKRVTMPLFYKNKQSFGDADILLSMEGFDGNMRDYIVKTFAPNEIFHNGNCWSLDYKELQVDLITVSAEDFDTNEMYLSYNDLGNFIGRISQGFGLKYGQEGLWYEHFFKGMNIARIEISRNYPDIFKFLGLSYERYLQGFDELEDIFEYISTCKFFNWKMFQMDQLNKINRDRNAKRNSYMTFLKWVDEHVADENHEYKFDKSQDEYNKMIAEAFPYSNLQMEIRRAEYEYCQKLYIKSKFNGGDVMRKYGLQGKELGEAMDKFKAIINSTQIDETYEEYILENTPEQIYSDFEVFLESQKAPVLVSGVAYKIPVIESEGGWGSKIDDYMVCLSKEDALQFCKEFNSKNTEPITPSWYMRADPDGENITLSGKQYQLLLENKQVWWSHLKTIE